MMERESNLFRDTRKQSLYRWEAATNRDCELLNDDITESLECKWQNTARDELGHEHISIFCSLGEWASNISDILKDPSRDRCDFLDDEHRQALFRYYTRFLLVVSEIISDFQKMVEETKSCDSKQSREFLSRKRGEVDSVILFVNKVCKHKAENIHSCNHHLPIWFEDCSEKHSFTRPISIAKLEFAQPDGILVPKLSYFVNVILHCYARLDDLFETEPDGFEMICSKYNGVSYIGRATL